MIPDLSNLRNLVFDREGRPSPSSLGIDLSNLPTIDPGTVTKMPATTTATTTGGIPGSDWWQDAGYPDAATALQSGNFIYDQNTGFQLKPGAVTPAMRLAAATTPEDTAVDTAAATTPEDTTTMVSDESTMSPISYSSETPSTKEMEAAADNTTTAVNTAVETASGGQGIATKEPVEKDLVRDDPVTAVEKAVNTAVETANGGQGIATKEPIEKAVETAVKTAPAVTTEEVKTAVEKAVETASGGQGIATGYGGDGYADTAEEEQSNNDVIKELIDSIYVNNKGGESQDVEAAIAAAIAAAAGEGKTEIEAKEEVEKELASDPATKAVDAAVGNGQPTTDKNIFGYGSKMPEGFIPPPKDAMVTQAFVDYYNPSTGATWSASSGGYTAPPGWVSTSKEGYEKNKAYYDNFLAGNGYDLSLLSGTGTGTDTGGTDTGTGTDTTDTGTGTDTTETDQAAAAAAAEQAAAAAAAEQAAAAAEQAAAAEAERQKQLAEMTLNYTIGQPAVGYNPYQSGQYQNNPYGSAGVPDMGGITSIPVPAAYTPNPYLTGGTT